MIQKAFKYRIYPTEEQQAELAKQFGCARFVYNAALELRKDHFFNTGESLSYEDMANALVQFKQNNPDLVWLEQADSQVLQQTLKDLDKAYQNFFRNHKLAKSIADAGWSQFVTFVEYKAAWAGSEVTRHERWFASSKTCYDCGAVNKELKLSDRRWVCQNCGVIHDRDENAAKNLRPNTVGTTGINAVRDMSSAVRHSAPEKFKTSLEAQWL